MHDGTESLPHLAARVAIPDANRKLRARALCIYGRFAETGRTVEASSTDKQLEEEFKC